MALPWTVKPCMFYLQLISTKCACIFLESLAGWNTYSNCNHHWLSKFLQLYTSRKEHLLLCFSIVKRAVSKPRLLLNFPQIIFLWAKYKPSKINYRCIPTNLRCPALPALAVGEVLVFKKTIFFSYVVLRVKLQRNYSEYFTVTVFNRWMFLLNFETPSVSQAFIMIFF